MLSGSDCVTRSNIAVTAGGHASTSPSQFRGANDHRLGTARARIRREMIKLTTYLGHTSPENTYWYIEAVPELLELASQRVIESEHMEEHP
jgi:hypothetical protein